MIFDFSVRVVSDADHDKILPFGYPVQVRDIGSALGYEIIVRSTLDDQAKAFWAQHELLHLMVQPENRRAKTIVAPEPDGSGTKQTLSRQAYWAACGAYVNYHYGRRVLSDAVWAVISEYEAGSTVKEAVDHLFKQRTNGLPF